jgi:hypothetical protein
MLKKLYNLKNSLKLLHGEWNHQKLKLFIKNNIGLLSLRNNDHCLISILA